MTDCTLNQLMQIHIVLKSILFILLNIIKDERKKASFIKWSKRIKIKYSCKYFVNLRLMGGNILKEKPIWWPQNEKKKSYEIVYYMKSLFIKFVYINIAKFILVFPFLYFRDFC